MASLRLLHPKFSEPRAVYEPDRVPELVPVLRPSLPSATDILPYLEAIDEQRWYSNWGPLVTWLEEEISRHYGFHSGGVVATANATSGLTAALLARNVRLGSLCLMPAWTFAATPHAARAAGMTPWFQDVDRSTWALDPGQMMETLRDAPGHPGAVIVVSPFGAPIDIKAWEAFEDQTGIAVVVDAAAGFDTLPRSRIPSVVSLHATKILGAGEGGFIATTDARLRGRALACCNFGFQRSRISERPALNAKMSEYHAAVALAGLVRWPATRARHAQIAKWYSSAMAGLEELTLQPGYGNGWVSGTTSVLLPPGSSARVARSLLASGIETRAWWSAGCHTQPAFAGCPCGPLPVTDELGARVLGLPHFPEMDARDVERVVVALSEALGSRLPGERIAALPHY
jgi:dTDP-4-amino-4,6-dideoxygalactose transaminase